MTQEDKDKEYLKRLLKENIRIVFSKEWSTKWWIAHHPKVEVYFGDELICSEVNKEIDL